VAAAADVMLSIGVVAFLTAATVATVVNSFARTRHLISRLGSAGFLVPAWNFFAPNPGVYDHFLLYRDRWTIGAIGRWKEIPHLSETRKWRAFIWNPEKLERKALLDFVGSLQELATREGVPLLAIKLSLPYLFVLNFVSTQPHDSHAVATQFLIMRRSRGDGTVSPLFVSGFHSVEPNSD
jgi:hypothetical protein